MDAAKQATPHSVLIEQLMDSRVPKTEREHAARMEIEMLREALRLPAQAHRQWVGLTDEERRQIALDDPIDWVAAIEAKLKEKNR